MKHNLIDETVHIFICIPCETWKVGVVRQQKNKLSDWQLLKECAASSPNSNHAKECMLGIATKYSKCVAGYTAHDHGMLKSIWYTFHCDTRQQGQDNNVKKRTGWSATTVVWARCEITVTRPYQFVLWADVDMEAGHFSSVFWFLFLLVWFYKPINLPP